MVAQPAGVEPPEADLLPNSRYAVALERQLETLHFMRTRKPFNTVARHVAREEGAPVFKDDFRMDVAIGEALERATPYLWGTEMADLLEANADTLEEWTLAKEDLVDPFGYIWFERPLPITPGDPEEIRAFLWEPIERGTADGTHAHAAYKYGSTGMRWASEAGYMVTTFTGYRAGQNLGLAQMNVRHGTPRTPIFWPVGRRLTGFIEGIREQYTNADFRRSVRAIAGMPPMQHAEQLCRFARLFAVATALTNQKITRIAGARGDRASRRRAQQLLGKPDVPLTRVVLLRTVDYVRTGEAPEPGEGVDWQYRWTVRGHWRKQWYPSENRHKSIYIHGYVKGPTGKPFKPGLVLKGVVR